MPSPCILLRHAKKEKRPVRRREWNALSDPRSVCFSCLTPYHVFVSYILSKTVYKDDYKTILFSDHYHRQIYERSPGLKLWDEVILIEEKNKPWQSIEAQLNRIDFKKVDILHYFSIGAVFQLLLMDRIQDHTKLILTEEGVGTHFIKEGCECYKERLNMQRPPIDFRKVSEIWLFDQRLYVSEFKTILRDIAFKEYLDSDLKLEFRDELNTLFDYKHEKQEWDILFFDQTLTLAGITSYAEERSLLAGITKAAENFNLAIKKHPTDYDGKYAGLGATILKCGNTPWEVVYLNEYIEHHSDLKNKIYMSYDSSAFLNTRTAFKVLDGSNHFIGLSKLLGKMTHTPQISRLLERYYERFKALYGTNYYEVESIDALEKLLTLLR